MPVRLCSTRGCPERAVYRGRCPAHARLNERATHSPEQRRIYNSKRWQILRRWLLFDNPLCQCGCGELATDVDHVVPLDQGGDPWDPSNLQCLARNCHSRKTRMEQATQHAGP
jgi:5-methylcytosine-specific restriction enzyme A